MNCHVKVELLNPADDSVAKSVEADGVITNAHKYLSTCGYPFISRTESVTLASMCLDLTAGGCVAFENAQSADENDYKFDLSDKKVAWGTRYSEDYSAFSSKYGALNKDLSTFDRRSFTKVWDWSESQGNGKINSVCLTHAAGAGAVDNTPPPDTTVAYTMGNDGAPVISCPTGNSALGTAAFQANTNYMCSRSIRPSDAYGVRPDVFYYQTDNSIICLNTKSLNVETTDSTGKSVFRHTFRYRRIDKKWMYKWEGGVLLSAREKNYCQHLLSYPEPLTDEVGNKSYLEGDWDGELTFDTTSSIKTMFGGYNSSTGNNGTGVYLEDSFGFALFSKGINSYVDENGKEVDVGFADSSDVGLTTRNSNALVTYIITGETPYVKTFESHYRCALSQGRYSTTGYISRGIIILKDFSYIYKSYRGTKPSYASYNYIARRMLSEDTLVWKVDLGNTISTGLPLKRFYWDSDYFCLPYVNNSSSSTDYSGGVYYTVRKNLDGSVVGYFLDNIKDPITTNLVPKDNNLFILDSVGHTSTSYGFNAYLSTNYMWLKANLPTELVKTAAYKMRITVKVNY